MSRCGNCTGPSWWGCELRGCYTQAKENYGSQVESRNPHERSDWRGLETDTGGMPLYGSCSREAIHRTHMIARKVNDE